MLLLQLLCLLLVDHRGQPAHFELAVMSLELDQRILHVYPLLPGYLVA